MAYREFKNEPYYKAPDVKFMPNTQAMLRQAMGARLFQQRQNRALAANFQADKLASKFTTDQDKLNMLTNDITQSGVYDFKNNGVMSPQTIEKMTRARGYKEMSDAQWTMKEDLEKAVNDRVIRGPKPEKNYFNKDVAQQKIVEAAYGQPHEDIDWTTRGQRLNAVANQIGKDYLHEFNKDAWVTDYVDNMKTQQIDKETKGMSGVKTGKTVNAVFFDENGVPKVTDQHAINMLNSSPDIQERYRQEVNTQLIDDARKMASTKDGAWVGDLLKQDPNAVIKLFRDKPELNTESKVPPGVRERELAKADLENKQRITLKNSYDASGYDEGASRGITSKDYGMENAWNQNQFGGAGGVFVNKKTGTKGIPIKIGPAFDKTSGKITGNDKSPRTLFADTFNLAPVDQNGKVVDIVANSIEEQINKINAFPDAAFQNLNLKTVVHGKSYNDRDLDNARQEYKKLQLTPEQSMTDEERKRYGELGATLQELDQNPELAPEIVQSKLGVVVEDLVKPIERGTVEAKEIKGKLGTHDITDPKNWDADMKRLAAAFDARKKQAQDNGYGKPAKVARTEENLKKMSELGGKKTQAKQPYEVEQNGNIFLYDPATKQATFVRKK